jgi:pimeloyl-ACP methyl ester carboxylesterase
MGQYHYHPVELDHDHKTTAFWAEKPNRTLLVFVHGFGGSATETWVDFPSLLSLSEKARRCDCIFYGYDGLRTRAFVSALMLLDFLDRVCTDPATFINATLPGEPPRPATFAFDRIVVVAHSLGAIVSRQALVSAHKAPKPWAKNVELVFFAPAHSGSDLPTLVGEVLTGIPYVKVAAPGGKAYAQVLIDLDPKSQLLAKLKDAVKSALPNAPNVAAKRVILAENDRVIDPSPFIPEDPDPPVLFYGRGHVDVCKPDAKFRRPLMELEALL